MKSQSSKENYQNTKHSSKCCNCYYVDPCTSVLNGYDMLHVAFILKQLIYAQNTFVAYTDLGPNESKANCKFLISFQAKKRCPRPLEKLPPLKKGAVGLWPPSHRRKLKTNWPAGRLFFHNANSGPFHHKCKTRVKISLSNILYALPHL